MTMTPSNDEIIARISARQASHAEPPLTCGNDSRHGLLTGCERDGRVELRCPDCEYTETSIPDLPPLEEIGRTNPEDNISLRRMAAIDQAIRNLDLLDDAALPAGLDIDEEFDEGYTSDRTLCLMLLDDARILAMKYRTSKGRMLDHMVQGLSSAVRDRAVRGFNKYHPGLHIRATP